jgi:hypothetical protein
MIDEHLSGVKMPGGAKYYELPQVVTTPDVDWDRSMTGTLEECKKLCSQNHKCWGFYRQGTLHINIFD